MSNAQEFYQNVPAAMEKTKKAASTTVTAFGSMFSKIMTDGAISLREKELIALSIGVAVHCPPCIYAHVRKCLDTGSTREQILEAAAVAVVMGGGPAYMHVMEVVEALDALGK
ncbi:MAG: carboxymuconolactone decarboxylase family protein [Planctomycetaceae bacterium]|nr:carboxymuconolactone decarboxylase family protein [Planctomycetaceae bacterium]